MNVVLEWVMGSPSSQAGAIDVIAVRKPDGSISCSPFHVKLAKSSKKGEKKVVKLKVNGKPVDLSMKLGPAGEAFFVERTREFSRPLAPVHDGRSQFTTMDTVDTFSPRNDTEETCSPLPVDVVADIPLRVSKNDLIHTSLNDATHSRVHVPSAPPDSTGVGISSSSDKQVHAGLIATHSSRPRSYSDSDAITLARVAALEALRHPPNKSAVPSEEAQQQDGQESTGAGLGKRRARAASDMSDWALSASAAAHRSAGGRTVGKLDSITASSSSATLEGAEGTAKDTSAIVGAESTVPTKPAPVTSGAGATAEQEEEQHIPTEAEEPNTAAAVGAVSWMWRWGTLPVKKKSKSSSSDLQQHMHAAVPTQPQHIHLNATESTQSQKSDAGAGAGAGTSANTTGGEDDKVKSDVATTASSRPPARPPMLLKDVRVRAVSLPQMHSLGRDDGAGTPSALGAARARRLGHRGRHHSHHHHHNHNNHQLHLPGLSRTGGPLRQLVTAVETDIPHLPITSAAAGVECSAEEFAQMFQAASVDCSSYRALSLCGHLLITESSSGTSSGTGGDGDGSGVGGGTSGGGGCGVPASPGQLRAVLQQHRVTPKDVATQAVMDSPHLVVVLGDHLLPLAAAEKLLVARSTRSAASVAAGASAAKRGSSGIDAEAEVTDAEIAAAMLEASAPAPALAGTGEAEAVSSWPEWAGRRISTWGGGAQSGSEGAAAGPAPVTDAAQLQQREGEVNTPLGLMTWQESFSDLVQAYRVQSISAIHSQARCGQATTARESYAVSPLLQELIVPNGQHPVSYRELWRRQQESQSHALASGSSFTALLTLDAGSNSSLYEMGGGGGNWAASSDDRDHEHDGGYGVGYALHPERLSDASSQHSLPMLISLEHARECGLQDEVSNIAAATCKPPTVPSTTSAQAPLPPINTAMPHSAPNTSRNSGYMHDAPARDFTHTRSSHASVASTTATAGAGSNLEYVLDGDSSRQSSLCEEGDTDNDNLSLQDIDCDDISPEPAGGDFYDSDTDSYLSLSLEEGEGGAVSHRGASGKSGAFQAGAAGGAGLSVGNRLSGTEHSGGDGLQRRRFKRYRYRKVLVPSQEQLDLLDLRDGPNDIVFELDGCAPLKCCLFVWPSDAKVVVTDLEGIFCRGQRSQPSGGVWISFLGGGSYYSSTTSKTEFDSVIKLFAGLSRQGYKIIYLAQGAQSSGPSASSLLSSQEYLAGFKATTGESLPPGPVFKSPDSLVRAFGASRTEVFKASALRGVKSLFPQSHNPYHACFCTREGDAVPFARFGFPEGRIFLVSEKGEVRSGNRTCVLSFPRLNELLHQVFPYVAESEHSMQAKKRRQDAVMSSLSLAAPSPVTSTHGASLATPLSASAPSPSATSVPTTPAGASVAGSTASFESSMRPRSQRVGSTDDTYNDFNYWKIPPAIIEDEY